MVNKNDEDVHRFEEIILSIAVPSLIVPISIVTAALSSKIGYPASTVVVLTNITIIFLIGYLVRMAHGK